MLQEKLNTAAKISKSLVSHAYVISLNMADGDMQWAPKEDKILS